MVRACGWCVQPTVGAPNASVQAFGVYLFCLFGHGSTLLPFLLVHHALRSSLLTVGSGVLGVGTPTGSRDSFDLFWETLEQSEGVTLAQMSNMLTVGDVGGWTPLHVAFKRASTNPVLHDAGCEVHGNKSNTHLHTQFWRPCPVTGLLESYFAALRSAGLTSERVQQLLLKKTRDGWTPLHQATASDCSVKLINALMQEIRAFGDDVLLANLEMKTKQGFVPSRPKTKTNAAEVNSYLNTVKHSCTMNTR